MSGPKARWPEVTVRRYVQYCKARLGYDWGSESRRTGMMPVLGEPRKVYCFTMRSMASGRAFQRKHTPPK